MADDTKNDLLAQAAEAGIVITDPGHTTKAQVAALIEHPDDREAHDKLAPHTHAEGTSDGSFADPLPDAPNEAASGDGVRPADPATADQAIGRQHPASIVKELPPHLKCGPGSHQSYEIRPDEQDLAPGTSALQARRPHPGEEAA